jgi:hypothetical protein
VIPSVPLQVQHFTLATLLSRWLRPIGFEMPFSIWAAHATHDVPSSANKTDKSYD